jgi:hypothetical protein
MEGEPWVKTGKPEIAFLFFYRGLVAGTYLDAQAVPEAGQQSLARLQQPY